MDTVISLVWLAAFVLLALVVVKAMWNHRGPVLKTVLVVTGLYLLVRYEGETVAGLLVFAIGTFCWLVIPLTIIWLLWGRKIRARWRATAQPQQSGSNSP